MNWKSFKQEKPLDGQRILIYSPIMGELPELPKDK